MKRKLFMQSILVAIFLAIVVSACQSYKPGNSTSPETAGTKKRAVNRDLPREIRRLSPGAQEVYRVLSTLPEVDFNCVGTILEEFAKYKLQEKFSPDRYLVTRSVSYYGSERMLGELDTVIIDRTSKKVVLIGECKLTKNFTRAKQKAQKQLDRIRNTIKKKLLYKLEPSKVGGFQLTPSSFTGKIEYWIIGCRDATKHGFDYEVDLGRDEADIIQKYLLRL